MLCLDMVSIRMNEICGSILDKMEYIISHTKSMLVVNYNVYRDDGMMAYFIDTLPDDVCMEANKNYPCVIVKYRHHN